MGRAGVNVTLMEAEKPWNSGSRDGGREYDADGDARQRGRPGPYYGSRPWRGDGHRYRASRTRSSNAWLAAGAAASTWNWQVEGADPWSHGSMNDVRRDSMTVVIACMVLGVIIGFVLNYCLRRLGATTPGATLKLKSPQRESKPTSAGDGTSLNRRVTDSSTQADSREGDAERSLPEDVGTYISTDMKDVNAGRVVIVTRTGLKFHYHVNCYGLRKSTTLALMDLRKIEGLAPCSVCTGAPSGRV